MFYATGNEFTRRKFKVALLGTALLVLGGCEEILLERFPPEDDYCEEIGRALTDNERKISALLFAYDDKFLHHFQEYKIKNATTSNSIKNKIVMSYLSIHPNCCAVMQPEFIRLNYKSSRNESSSWNRDVVFATEAVFFGNFHEKMRSIRDYKAYKISACGVTKEIFRG